MGRQRQIEAVASVFGELAATDPIGASPAFAPDRLQETARRFLDLAVLPMLMRALFGEDLAALRAEIEPHAPLGRSSRRVGATLSLAALPQRRRQ